MSLFLIATPIGNLKDVSERVRETLEMVDILLCEDTRVTFKLLGLLGIKNKPKLESFYDEVEEEKTKIVLGWLGEGKQVGLVTDAGTPLVSDPGWFLVDRSLRRGYKVEAIAGPSAFLQALLVSGLPTDRFFFLGFLPKSEGRRVKILKKMEEVLPVTVIVYESPKRLISLLGTLERLFPVAEVAVVQELSKSHEQVRRGRAGELREFFLKEKVRGEMAVLWRLPRLR